jgi:hypothetical protein
MDIATILKEKGPLLGRDLAQLIEKDIFHTWKECIQRKDITVMTAGKSYLRFDRNVEELARLSPSIERGFATYTVVGVPGDERLSDKVNDLADDIGRISARKLKLAKTVVEKVSVMAGMTGKLEDICYIIGGDVPLGMAHDDPRPETSTGLMVSGSDLDIVIIYRDGLGEDHVKNIDEAIYSMKYDLLNNPVHREEIDYIIKPFSRIKEQAAFATFKDKVACKIIMEGELLHGGKALYEEILGIMEEMNIPGRIKDMEEQAALFRDQAQTHLLGEESISHEDYVKYFTTTDEFGEIY